MARVLIVEDEQTDRVILGYIVKRTGREVYFASDGEQALETYLKNSIEIIITDLVEFIEAVRTLFPEVPIIAVSGEGPDLLAAAKRMGAFATFRKPIDPHELVEALENATSTWLSRAAPKRRRLGAEIEKESDRYG